MKLYTVCIQGITMGGSIGMTYQVVASNAEDAAALAAGLFLEQNPYARAICPQSMTVDNTTEVS